MAAGLKITFDDAGNGAIDRGEQPECAEGIPCSLLEITDLMRWCHYTDPPLPVLDYFLKKHGRQCPLGKWWLGNDPCWRDDERSNAEQESGRLD